MKRIVVRIFSIANGEIFNLTLQSQVAYPLCNFIANFVKVAVSMFRLSKRFIFSKR